MNRLIVLLGTGQTKLREIRDKSYRQTKYQRQDTQQTYETPFFAEALVQLYPKRFDAIEIFGTKDSMWETLFVHCLEDNITEKDAEVFNHIVSEERNISDEQLQHIAQTFVRKCQPNIKEARCSIIPV
ncbi:MAG: hypothetical protein NZM30_13275, partial [Geminocystis sp.]|nr:hypothetical protein [Geminocystis sp.]